jgi:hypothetical protein
MTDEMMNLSTLVEIPANTGDFRITARSFQKPRLLCAGP